MSARAGLALLLAAAAGPAGAQTMLDQQQRLIDLHDLLLDLPPVQAPAALRPLELGIGAEVIGVPRIDGTTGAKRQLTASDHTRLFPRPRLLLGLPVREPLRAFVGLAYIPPITLRDVRTHYAGGEAGLAWAPGPLAVSLRGHAVFASSRSPVTDPLTRDTLETLTYGADVLAGWELDARWARLTPYAGLGVTHLDGRFRVTSDGVVLRSDATLLAVHVGLRLLAWRRLEAVAELDAYPSRLVHPNFRVGYVFGGR